MITIKQLLHKTVMLIALFAIGIAVNAQKNGTVYGTVTSQSGEKLPAVNVILQGTNIGISTGTSGLYQLKNIPSGHYTIIASFMGYLTYEAEIVIQPGVQTEHNILLKKKYTD